MSVKSKLRDWVIRRELNNQAKEKTMLGNVWTWLSGKKTVFGAIITAVTSIVAALPVVLPLFVKDANKIASIVGAGVTILGLLHKAYKWIYKEGAIAQNVVDSQVQDRGKDITPADVKVEVKG